MPSSPSVLPALLSRARAPFRIARPRPAPEGEGPGGPDHLVLAAALDGLTDGWTVDYEALVGSRELAAYREEIAGFDADRLDRRRQIAFWVNAYNATVLGLIADRWPVGSVLDVPGAFVSVRSRVGGAEMTLDEIEHGKARRLGDPRVHLGLNCGSVGCPPLRVYGPDPGDELDANGRRYLADPRRGARPDGDRIQLSRVFQWFGGDFAPIGGGPSLASTLLVAARPSRVLPALRPLLPGELRGLSRVAFLDYDWSVNAARGSLAAPEPASREDRTGD